MFKREILYVALIIRARLTSQIMRAQIDLRHTVAQFANVGWELEADVIFELDGAPFDEFPTQQLDRDGSCASDTHLRLVVFTWCYTMHLAASNPSG